MMPGRNLACSLNGDSETPRVSQLSTGIDTPFCRFAGRQPTCDWTLTCRQRYLYCIVQRTRLANAARQAARSARQLLPCQVTKDRPGEPMRVSKHENVRAGGEQRGRNYLSLLVCKRLPRKKRMNKGALPRRSTLIIRGLMRQSCHAKAEQTRESRPFAKIIITALQLCAHGSFVMLERETRA